MQYQNITPTLLVPQEYLHSKCTIWIVCFRFASSKWKLFSGLRTHKASKGKQDIIEKNDDSVSAIQSGFV